MPTKEKPEKTMERPMPTVELRGLTPITAKANRDGKAIVELPAGREMLIIPLDPSIKVSYLPDATVGDGKVKSTTIITVVQ